MARVGGQLVSAPLAGQSSGRGSSSEATVAHLAVAGVGRLEDSEDVAAHPAQLGQPGVDAFEDLLEAPPFARTRRVTGVEAAEGVDDLLEGEPERLQRLSEPDPLDGLGRVAAVARWLPLGWR